MDEEKYRIPTISIILMTPLALLLDGIKILCDFIYMGWLIMTGGYLLFGTWLYFRKVKIFDTKNHATTAVSFLLGFIPWLPPMTFFVVRSVLKSRVEDLEKSKAPKGKQDQASDKNKQKKETPQKNGGKEKETEERKGVDSGVRPAGESPRLEEAGRELSSTQTGGDKPAKPTAEEAQDWKNKPRQKQEKSEKGGGEEKAEAGENLKQQESEGLNNAGLGQQQKNLTETGEEEGELEDIVMQKGETANLMDPYREPVPQREAKIQTIQPEAKKDTEENIPFEEAA